MNNTQKGERFYKRMGVLLIALIFAGFVPFIKTRFDTHGYMSPILMVHGLLMLGWYGLFVYQASLVSAGDIKRHVKLGKSSLILVGVIILTGVMVMNDSFARGSNGGTPFPPEQFIILPILDLLLFAIFYALAYLNRKTAQTHKHYMLLTGIVMLEPATARIGMTIGFMPLGMLLLFGLLGAVAVYDRKHQGAVHRATKVGFTLLAARFATLFIIGPTEGWARFAHWLLG